MEIRKTDEAIKSLLTSRIPSRKQIYDTWIKARFEDSKHDTKAEHISPLVDKAETLNRISGDELAMEGGSLPFPSRPIRRR